MEILLVIFGLIKVVLSYSFSTIGVIIIGYSLWKLFKSLNIKPYYGLIPFYNLWLISKKSKQKYFVFWVFMISLIAQIIYSRDFDFFDNSIFMVYDFVSLILVSISLLCWTIMAINFGKLFGRSTLFGFGLALVPVIFVFYLALNHINNTKRNREFVDTDKDKIHAKFKDELPKDFMNDNVIGGEAFFDIGYIFIMNIPLWLHISWRYIYFTPTAIVYVERDLWKGLNICYSFNHDDLEYIKFKANKVMWSELFIKPKSHPQLSMKIKPVFAQFIEKNNDHLSQMSSDLVLQKI